MRKTIMIGLGVAALVAVSGQAAQAAGDAAAGQKVFTTQCKTCHSAEPNKHMTGPSLFGIYGAKAGSTTFPRYKGLVAADFVWDDAKLMEYLTDPKAFVTKYTKNTTTAMTFKLGEGKEQQREDVIAYLKTLK